MIRVLLLEKLGMKSNKVFRLLLTTRAYKLLSLIQLSRHFLQQNGWLKSRRAKESLDRYGNPIPWFTYSSVHFFQQKLKQSFNVLEFGSGNSTIWFANKVKNVLSIEGNPEFYEKNKNRIGKHHNVDYVLIEDDNHYFEVPLKYTNEFDIIVIDGKQRVACVKNSLKALKKGGVIIWDDTERIDYKEGFDFLSENKFKRLDFYGLAPIIHTESTTSVFYRIGNCLDI
jgi:SAM-dependent methyltransferase